MDADPFAIRPLPHRRQILPHGLELRPSVAPEHSGERRAPTGSTAKIAVAAFGETSKNHGKGAALSRKLLIQLPDDLYRELEHEATASGKSIEQVTVDRVAETRQPAAIGSLDALEPFFGSWQMLADERLRLETLLDEERHLE